MTMRLQFVEALFGVGRTDDVNLVWGETQGKEMILKIVIARLTEIRRKLKTGSKEQFLMDAFHKFPSFSGVW